MKTPLDISRRGFLAFTAATAALGWTRSLSATEGGLEVIDTHVYLGRWPFDRLPHEQPAEVAKVLGQRHVASAWTGSFEGLLHKDIAGANARLFEDCRSVDGGLLIPFGSINPTLPDWEEDVRRCDEEFQMPGIRLHPTYHGYTLDNERFSQLLAMAASRKLIVQLVAWMDDQKYPYLTMPTRHVDLAPLASQLKRVANTRVVLSNAVGRTNETWLPELAALPGVYFDYGLVEPEKGLNNLLKVVPPEKTVFGSGFPLGDFQATVAKLRRANLPNDQENAIHHETARKMVK